MITPLALPASARAASARVTTCPISTLEVLEARIAPAVVSPGVFKYTDSDGDAVAVQVTGGFKSVDFIAADGSDVMATGGDVKAIIVTGARADFSLTFADENSGVGGGDGVIDLGVISGPAGAKLPLIKGVFTVPTDDATTFDLGGYKGEGFSKSGGLTIHGGLVAVTDGTGGLELGTIGKGNVVSIRDGVEAGTLAVVKGKVAGTLFLGGEIHSSVALGSVSGAVELGSVSSTITVDGNVSGHVSVSNTTVDEMSGDSSGLVWIKGGLATKGVVTGGDHLNLQINGGVRGAVRVQGDLLLSAAQGLNSATVNTQGSLTINTSKDVLNSTLDVGGRIEVDSQIVGSVRNSAVSALDDLTLEITRSVINSRIVTSDEGSVAIGGYLRGSRISAGADLDISVTDYISGSEVLPDGVLTLQVLGSEKSAGDVVKSWIGSRESGVEIGIAGKVSGSDFVAGSGAFIAVGKSWQSNSLISGFDARLVAGGSVLSSSFASGSDLSVETSGALRGSLLLPANDLEVVAGKLGISGVRLETAEGDASVNSLGPVATTVILSGRDADISAESTIAGDVLVHAAQDISITAATKKVAAKVGAARDVTVLSEGAFIGAIKAGEDLVLHVAQLAPSAHSGRISPGLPYVAAGIRAGGDLDLQTTGSVNARLIEIDGDVVGLGVGQNFDATLHVGGSCVPGEAGTNVTAVAGTVSARSLIEIRGNMGDADSAAKVAFAGAFKGRLQIGGDLRTDLEFGASVSRILIGGAVGTTALGDGIAQILVNGSVGSLRTGSLFVRADAGGGEFVDGEGVTTGMLQATSAKNVAPTPFV